MNARCQRPMSVDSAPHFCGKPAGHEWPHRYIEKRFRDRLRHEWALLRTGYTKPSDFVLAMTGRTR